jgi:hypothetical protein
MKYQLEALYYKNVIVMTKLLNPYTKSRSVLLSHNAAHADLNLQAINVAPLLINPAVEWFAPLIGQAFDYENLKPI